MAGNILQLWSTWDTHWRTSTLFVSLWHPTTSVIFSRLYPSHLKQVSSGSLQPMLRQFRSSVRIRKYETLEAQLYGENRQIATEGTDRLKQSQKDKVIDKERLARWKKYVQEGSKRGNNEIIYLPAVISSLYWQDDGWLFGCLWHAIVADGS
jgi:hypothetical protein